MIAGVAVISGHPRFPNPTLQEALCEIHFSLPEGVQWDASSFGKYYERIAAEFPQFEPAAPAGLQLQLSSGQIGFLPPQSRMRYKHRSRNLVLQLGENLLTVNVLPKYESWTRMRADILQGWEWAREVFQPAAILRIGLRYIDLIPRDDSAQLPREWLAPNNYVAAAALASTGDFLSRVEAHESTGRRVVVTVGQPQGTDARGLLLDIDCIEECEQDSSLEIEPSLEALHEVVWKVFSAFITPRLQRLLEGGKP
jgi:uncharacterized protein (TIGR04255 family)